MTDLLKKAFEAASHLPEAEQRALAVAILAEMTADTEWELRFAHSAETLADLADEALAEHRRGATKRLDPDEL